MIAKRWARQDDYDAEVYAESASSGVPVSLIKATIAAESAFNPQAFREEAPRSSLPPTQDFPQGGDASYGLMQILSRTARALHYTGSLGGLFNPRENIRLGAKLLRDNLARTNWDVADSVSAYNGGFRPQLGYGERSPSGNYANQAYVDRVIGYADYFRQWEAEKGGGTVGAPSFRESPGDSGGRLVSPPQMKIGAFGWSVAVVCGLALWALLMRACL